MPVPLTFDGNDYATGANSNLPDGNDAFTITAWYMGTNANNAVILDFGKEGSTSCEQCYLYLTSGGVLLAGFGGAGNNNDTGTTQVNDNAWHFLAAVYDGSVLKLWVDDDWDGSDVTPSDQPAVSLEDPVYMGESMSEDGQGLTGALRDVRVFNAALTDTQLTTLFEGNDATEIGSEIRHWKLNEGSGDTLADAHNSAFDLTLAAEPNKPTWSSHVLPSKKRT